MLELFKAVASYVALAVEAAAIIIVSYGAVEAFYGSVLAARGRSSKVGQRKGIWLRFGVWLLLGLEFELGADIIRTSISPTWTEIGQLAAIGVIRTFLNIFLERDLERYESKEDET